MNRWSRPRARSWTARSLAARLMLAHVTVLVVAMAAVLAVVAIASSDSALNSVDSSMVDDIRELNAAISARPVGQPLDAFTHTYLYAPPFESGSYLLVQYPGQPVRGNSGSHALRTDPQVLTWLASPPASPVTAEFDIGATHYRARIAAVQLNGQTVGGTVAATDMSAIQQQQRATLLVAGGEAGAAVLIAILSTFLVLRRVLGAVGSVTQTASLITSTNPGRRLDERPSDDEIGRLVRTFNSMLDRLEAASLAQRRLLSDVSHQMRTPLTVMRGHLEVARRTDLASTPEARETLDLLLDELTHTSALVDRMLVLGHSLEPDFVQPDPVDLREFVGDVYTAARALAPRRWVRDPAPDIVLLVDRDKLRGALLNLVDNAIKATTPEDEIRIGATLGPGNTIAITVSDTGRGIPADMHARIFERFERGGPADERGSGLGLAIVKAVSEAHGGNVTLDSSVGAGCTVRIVLPGSRIVPQTGDSAS